MNLVCERRFLDYPSWWVLPRPVPWTVLYACFEQLIKRTPSTEIVVATAARVPFAIPGNRPAVWLLRNRMITIFELDNGTRARDGEEQDERVENKEETIAGRVPNRWKEQKEQHVLPTSRHFVNRDYRPACNFRCTDWNYFRVSIVNSHGKWKCGQLTLYRAILLQ